MRVPLAIHHMPSHARFIAPTTNMTAIRAQQQATQ